MECSLFDVGCWTDWLVTELKAIFLWVYESILNGLAAIVEAIPAPEWMTASSFSLPPSVLYYTSLFEVPYGLSIVASAYTLRFVLRRIPFIG